MDRHAPLAHLVIERPARAAVFDRFGLDYCCGGAEPLDVACERLGLDAETVAADAEFASAADTTAHDCADLPVAALLDHLLTTHHEYLHAELPALRALATKVREAHVVHHPELLAVHALVLALADDLEPHLMKEERVLFPAVRQLLADPATQFGNVSIANPVRMMGMEHEHAGAILGELRAATDGYTVPPDACASWEQLYDRLAQLDHDTRVHIFEENELLFPRVLELETRA